MAGVTKHRLQHLFEDIHSVIGFDHPKLSVKFEEKIVVVEGVYNIAPSTTQFANSGAIAEYQIRIEFCGPFPRIEPIVFETGNTIPRNEDHHINRNGSCCIVIWEVWMTAAQDISLQAYFDGPLKNFFLGQQHKTHFGVWPFDEEDHGKPGLISAFADLLGCAKKEQMVRYLLRVLSKDWPKGHWPCPCGSGKIIRMCCAANLAQLSQRVPPSNARRMLSRLNIFE